MAIQLPVRMPCIARKQASDDGRTRVFSQKCDLGFGEATKRKEGNRLQMVGSKKKEASFEKDGEKYKTWLVAKGYAQREGENYNEIFSPVVKHILIRVIFTLVAMHDLELE